MKFSSNVKPLSHLKNDDEHEQTQALLKLLALGNREIELGKFRDADEVFAQLDQMDR